MALFTEQEIKDRFAREQRIQNSRVRTRYFSATDVLNEGRVTDTSKTYDIFLSHSSKDKEMIAGLKLILTDMGFTVYVDWNDDELNPDNVTSDTAAVLRERMKQCRSLLYAFSENASDSKWMPWELGYFDGLKDSKVAVLPISKTTKTSFEGTEFVGFYYVVQIARIQGKTEKALWVYEGKKFVKYNNWLKGQKPYLHI